MRAVLIGIAVAAIVLAATGGHVFFLPLLFVPLGLLSLRRRRRPSPARATRPGGRPWERA